MSYSFSIRGANKAEAKAAVSQHFDSVVAAQPIHAFDRDKAAATADAFIDLLDDRDEHDVSVSVAGSVVSTENDGIALAAISVVASVVTR